MFVLTAFKLQRRFSAVQRTLRRLTISQSISSASILPDSNGSTNDKENDDQKPRSAPLALIFDTETSGMYHFDKRELDPAQPALMQLGMIMVDTASWEPKLQTSMLIEDEVSWVDQDASKIHGISVQDCQRYGVPQAVACQLFRHLLTRVDCLVAHNLDFDMLIMKTAMLRSSVTMPRLDDLQRVCTMKDCTEVLKLSSDHFSDRYKWPSLQQAFRHFTDCEMDGGHDAMVDAEACLTVFRNLVECGAVELKERAVDKDDRIARELVEHRRSRDVRDKPKTSPAPVSASRNSNNGPLNVENTVAARPGELHIILDLPTDKAETTNGNNDTVGGFRISGNTYKYRQQIRALGGCTWSRAAQAWVFHDRSRLKAAQTLVNSTPLSRVAPVGKEEPTMT